MNDSLTILKSLTYNRGCGVRVTVAALNQSRSRTYKSRGVRVRKLCIGGIGFGVEK